MNTADIATEYEKLTDSKLEQLIEMAERNFSGKHFSYHLWALKQRLDLERQARERT